MSSMSALNTVAYGPHAEMPDSPENAPEREVAMLVRDLFMRARDARRVLLVQWKRNYRVLNNRNYTPGNNAWDEEPAISSIWPVVASSVAWMTDQRPTIEVTPTSEPFSPYFDWYQKLANDMNVLLNSSFLNYALDGEITKALWDVYTYGIGYFKTGWEPWLADGLGDACFRRVDPFTIYPDPFARDVSELTYIVEARQMTIADVDRSWPGAAQTLAAKPWIVEAEQAPHRVDSQVSATQPRAAVGALAPATSPGTMPTGQKPGRPGDSPVVTVLEAWVRGHKIEDDEDDPLSAKVIDEWRCIVTCGDTVLMDEPAENVTCTGSHPYDRIVYADTGEWYGPCMTELLTPLQRLINWLLGAFNRNIYLMGNPVLQEDPRSASRNKRFSNRPGQRLEAATGTVSWLNPPQVHPQAASELIRYYEGKIETISGLSAMVRGFAPGGRNAQGVLDSVQDAAFVRVRLALRELERALRGVSSKMAATIAEFYEEARTQSIIGPDGQRTHLALQARHFYTLPMSQRGKRVPLRFSLVADAGSSLPTSKQARAAEAKHLFTIGAIDIYEMLKAMQWPNYAIVAQRVMQQQASAAQAEASKKKS